MQLFRHNTFSIKGELNAVIQALRLFNTLSKLRLYYICTGHSGSIVLLDVLLSTGFSTERVSRSCILVSCIVLSCIRTLCAFTRMQRLHFRIIYRFGLSIHACFSNGMRRNYIPNPMSFHLFEVGRSVPTSWMWFLPRTMCWYEHLNRCETMIVRIISIALLRNQWKYTKYSRKKCMSFHWQTLWILRWKIYTKMSKI